VARAGAGAERDRVSEPPASPAGSASSRARPEVQVFADVQSLARAAAEIVMTVARSGLRDGGRFKIALAGGSTPTRLYGLLATGEYARRIDWPRVEVFWGDERCVPPEHPASNYRSARESLLDQVPIPAENVHRMLGEVEPGEAAAAYERDLRASFATTSGPPRTDRGSRFDLVLLGLGADGHTASLFPGSAAIHEPERWVVAHRVNAAPSWRITLTPVLLNASAEVLFLVTGGEKAPALRRVLQGPHQPDLQPAQTIAPHSGRVRWLVEAGAASRL
jgi:6-phosphogluconolactonase